MANLKKFVLIEEGQCEDNNFTVPLLIIHNSWILPNNTQFYYPPRNIKHLVIHEEKPDPQIWKKCPIRRILYSHERYGVVQAHYTTHMNTDTSETECEVSAKSRPKTILKKISRGALLTDKVMQPPFKKKKDGMQKHTAKDMRTTTTKFNKQSLGNANRNLLSDLSQEDGSNINEMAQTANVEYSVSDWISKQVAYKSFSRETPLKNSTHQCSVPRPYERPTHTSYLNAVQNDDVPGVVRRMPLENSSKDSLLCQNFYDESNNGHFNIESHDYLPENWPQPNLGVVERAVNEQLSTDVYADIPVGQLTNLDANASRMRETNVDGSFQESNSPSKSSRKQDRAVKLTCLKKMEEKLRCGETPTIKQLTEFMCFSHRQNMLQHKRTQIILNNLNAAMANKTRQKYSNDLNEQWSAFNFPLNFEKFLEFEEYLSVNDKAEEFISYLENLLKTNCKTKPRSTLRMVLKGIISDEIFVYYFWAEEKKMAEETRLRWRRRRGNLLIPRCQHVS